MLFQYNDREMDQTVVYLPLHSISFPEAAILLVSDEDRDLWPGGILSPQIADFRLHCAESKVKPKMAERSGPDTFLEGVKFGLEKVGKANITLKQKQEEILKIIALTQKDVLAEGVSVNFCSPGSPCRQKRCY